MITGTVCVDDSFEKLHDYDLVIKFKNPKQGFEYMLMNNDNEFSLIPRLVLKMEQAPEFRNFMKIMFEVCKTYENRQSLIK
ncbi:MAG: hypothetical protein MJ247_03970 [Alphaproteobacteria bacterium]|nr:hypothetical protein [Alphaproteobacteria bacterium]